VDQGTDPFQLFGTVFARAAENAPVDHTAGVLATIKADGQPTTRVVLLKEFDATGFVFYTNYHGRKGRELAANPLTCYNFYWAWIGVQVRIEGSAEKVSAEESDAYFASRPRMSQIGAWASHQSEPLDSREVLLARVEELEAKYGESLPIPRPPHWGGYRITPTLIEFWYNGEARLHDRFEFVRDGAGWKVTRLNP
jgi:pyridoxamine 5'-phosphate oxidase